MKGALGGSNMDSSKTFTQIALELSNTDYIVRHSHASGTPNKVDSAMQEG